MKVRLRFFASLREVLGAGETVDVGAGTTVGALRDELVARGGDHARLLGRTRAVRCAVDQVMADEATAVRDGAEVAFFPPVTGG